MRRVLHILTAEADSLAIQIVDAQKASGNQSVQVIDLTERDPDYGALLNEIFEADSIQVW